MVLDGTRDLVQFVGPNNHAVNSFSALRLEETLIDLADILDIYGAHTYLAPENAYNGWKSFMDRVRQTLAQEPKPIWLDEYNVQKEWEHHVRDQPSHGTYIAEVIAASLDAKIHNTMLWSLFDQQYPAPLNESDVAIHLLMESTVGAQQNFLMINRRILPSPIQFGMLFPCLVNISAGAWAPRSMHAKARTACTSMQLNRAMGLGVFW